MTWTYGPCYITDLGKADLKDCLNAPDGHVQRRDVPVIDGHTYLIRQEFWKRSILVNVSIPKE